MGMQHGYVLATTCAHDSSTCRGTVEVSVCIWALGGQQNDPGSRVLPAIQVLGKGSPGFPRSEYYVSRCAALYLPSLLLWNVGIKCAGSLDHTNQDVSF